MTHADNIAWWALVLSVAGLVLHIPLSMMAHHYLPKIEDYVASHSRERLIKRIAKLQRNLDRLKGPTYFENVEWDFREHLFGVMYMLGLGGFALAVRLLFADQEVSTRWHLHILFSVFSMVGFVSAIALAGWNMFKSSALRPSKRHWLMRNTQSQIEALQVKLAVFKLNTSDD